MRLAITPIFLISLALAGCGGGGNALTGNNPGNNPPPGGGSSSLAITSNNAESSSGAAWNSAAQTAGLAGFTGAGGIVSNPGGNNKPAYGAPSAGTLIGVLSSIPFSDTQPCDVAGSMTVSGDIADPFTPTLTAGDQINVSATDCDDGLGEVLNGLLEMTVDAFSGDFQGGIYELTMTMTMTDFSVTTATDFINNNGASTATIDTLQSPQILLSVTGASLTTDSNTTSETLTSFQITQTLDGGQQPSPYTQAATGTLDSTDLAGIISYSTPVTFQGFDFDYPDSGELLITGDNSSARLIAVDNVNVRIEVDSDGDGVIDDTINTTWAALTGN